VRFLRVDWLLSVLDTTRSTPLHSFNILEMQKFVVDSLEDVDLHEGSRDQAYSSRIWRRGKSISI
jgi:hypothetical protein